MKSKYNRISGWLLVVAVILNSLALMIQFSWDKFFVDILELTLAFSQFEIAELKEKEEKNEQ